MNDFDLDDLRAILKQCRKRKDTNHLGRPFMSAYQIAIRFADAHPQHPLVMNLNVGGEDTGPKPSLANRIARFLSEEIKEGRVGDIESGVISHDLIEDLYFDCHGRKVRPSGLKTAAGHSIFRLVSK